MVDDSCNGDDGDEDDGDEDDVDDAGDVKTMLTSVGNSTAHKCFLYRVTLSLEEPLTT